MLAPILCFTLSVGFVKCNLIHFTLSRLGLFYYSEYFTEIFALRTVNQIGIPFEFDIIRNRLELTITFLTFAIEAIFAKVSSLSDDFHFTLQQWMEST